EGCTIGRKIHGSWQHGRRSCRGSRLMPRTLLRRAPFFEDKNRAFWTLQSAGWAGYFVLRALSGIANAMGWLFIVPTALTTATGYSLTLLMSAAYRRLFHMRPIATWGG